MTDQLTVKCAVCNCEKQVNLTSKDDLKIEVTSECGHLNETMDIKLDFTGRQK